MGFFPQDCKHVALLSCGYRHVHEKGPSYQSQDDRFPRTLSTCLLIVGLNPALCVGPQVGKNSQIITFLPKPTLGPKPPTPLPGTGRQTPWLAPAINNFGPEDSEFLALGRPKKGPLLEENFAYMREIQKVQ